MELRLKDTILNLAEGVDVNKFVANRAIATAPAEVKKLFINHGYNLDNMNGVFVKAFNLTTQELKEVEANLVTIDELGMQTIFNKNLQIQYFKKKFVSRLAWCIKNGIPYLNQDETFAAFLTDDEAFEKIKGNVQVNDTPNVTPNNEGTTIEEINGMNPEDRQVYNEIIEKLNYLVLANPMDTALATAVSNASRRVIAPILEKKYKWLDIDSMIASVMFDELAITNEDKNRIQELVSGAFQDEERKIA